MLIVDDKNYTLRASFAANGDLVLAGHDTNPPDIMGRDEYEYFYTVPAADVPSVRSQLGDPPDVLEAVRSLLVGRDMPSRAWREWLVANGVPYRFVVR